MMNETDEHNKWKHGYWRLKKENEALLLRIEQLEKVKQSLDDALEQELKHTSVLEDKVKFMFGDAKAVMHLMYHDGLTLNEGEWLLDEVYA